MANGEDILIWEAEKVLSVGYKVAVKKDSVKLIHGKHEHPNPFRIQDGFVIWDKFKVFISASKENSLEELTKKTQRSIESANESIEQLSDEMEDIVISINSWKNQIKSDKKILNAIKQLGVK